MINTLLRSRRLISVFLSDKQEIQTLSAIETFFRTLSICDYSVSKVLKNLWITFVENSTA